MDLIIPLPLLFFESRSKRELEHDPEISDIDRDRHFLACADCKTKITSQEARTSVKGGHEHSFFNPHGVIYRIGCYRHAPGCRPSSQPTADFSWFPGYRWRIVCCHKCFCHLGWSFEADHTFYGLILNRLIEMEEDAD